MSSSSCVAAAPASQWSSARELSALQSDLLQRSPFVQYVRACRLLQAHAHFFPLSQHEIEQLQRNGNSGMAMRH